jgi:ferredoxin
MAYVVTSPCFGCKYTDCVVVCPCDCFREGDQMLYIEPDSCIDCGACEPECPVEAICYEENVAEDQRSFIQLNAEMSRVCPPIVERRPPLSARARTSQQPPHYNPPQNF